MARREGCAGGSEARRIGKGWSGGSGEEGGGGGGGGGVVFCFKRKTAYEGGVGDWGADVSAADLGGWVSLEAG